MHDNDWIDFMNDVVWLWDTASDHLAIILTVFAFAGLFFMRKR